MSDEAKKILQDLIERSKRNIESLTQAEKDWESIEIPEVAINLKNRRLYTFRVMAGYGMGPDPLEIHAEDVTSKHSTKITLEQLKTEYLPYTPKNRTLFPKKED
jgi:transcriptional accessory protein Tex/SPT6